MKNMYVQNCYAKYVIKQVIFMLKYNIPMKKIILK